MVNLDKVKYWVQAYNLPTGFFSEHVAKIVGDNTMVYVESEQNNYNGIWRTFI